MKTPTDDSITPLARLSDLVTNPGPCNTGTARGRDALTHSLTEFGAARSIVADRHGVVIAGNKTLEIAATLNLPIEVVSTAGDRLVVVQRVDLDANDPKARRLAIADNRTGELNLAWDVEQLKAQMHDLNLEEFWSRAELETLIGEAFAARAGDPDALMEPRATDIQAGDLFTLGRHRLLCGDATDPATVARLLDGAKPVLMVTDPPYGVTYDPAWRAAVNGAARTAAGRVQNDDRVDWTAALAQFPGDVAYVWHAGLYAGTVAASLEQLRFDLRAQIIWCKQHFALSRGDYHWQHEPCWYAVRRGARKHWTGDRTQSTVWHVPNLNPIGGTPRDAADARTGHGTQKPVRLFEIPIVNHMKPADGIFDPFVGSGTALMAAEKTGRPCFAIDVDPRYVQATIDRWERYTGEQATALTREEVSA